MVPIPSLSSLYAGIRADLEAEFGVTIPVIGPSLLRAVAAVQAAKLKLYYYALGSVQKNIFADTADPESAGGTLERYGRVKIGRNPYPATQGVYALLVEATQATTIPAGTTFIADDDSTSPGALFILDEDKAAAGGPNNIDVRALEAGTGSKMAVGDTLTLTAPLAYVAAGAFVDSETEPPLPAETFEEYRQKVLQSYRLYPQGGASADYRLWGLDAAGTKQIYPYTPSGAPNEIAVYVEATIAASTDGMGTPTTAILNAVAADIETDPITGAGRRPLGVYAVNVAPVVVNKLDITIPGSATITPAQRTLITAALTDAVNAVRPFIPGADVAAERNDVFGINNIISVILSTIPGAQFTTPQMTYSIGAVIPIFANTIVFDQGNIPFLNSVSYA